MRVMHLFWRGSCAFWHFDSHVDTQCCLQQGHHECWVWVKGNVCGPWQPGSGPSDSVYTKQTCVPLVGTRGHAWRGRCRVIKKAKLFQSVFNTCSSKTTHARLESFGAAPLSRPGSLLGPSSDLVTSINTCGHRFSIVSYFSKIKTNCRNFILYYLSGHNAGIGNVKPFQQVRRGRLRNTR